MRIIIKNLPESTKKEELEAAFSKHGKITDIYMLLNSKGQFRRVGFIGYEKDEEAKKAQAYHDNSMFKNHKISVEIAKEEAVESATKGESESRRVLYTKTIYVKNLNLNADVDLIRDEFEKIGKVVDIKIEQRKEDANVVVKFKEGQHAVDALQKIRILGGRRVKICAYNETE